MGVKERVRNWLGIDPGDPSLAPSPKRKSSVLERDEEREERGITWSWGTVGGDSAGVNVTPGTALTNSAVFSCVRILAETLASLPLITYERMSGGGRQRATDFYLYERLHENPNEWMTSFELREAMQGHLALWGNAYAQLDYDQAGRIDSIFPLRPDRMLDVQIEGGIKKYKYQLPSGQTIWMGESRLWHLKAFGDGLIGYSPVELMRKGIGLALATEKFGGQFFNNGARPGGVLQHPGKLGKDAHGRLRESWNESHMGLDNAHKVAILEEGMQWKDTGMPLADAQFLETRKFQVTDIARMFRVPPHMIADLEHATFSNIEHQALEFVTHTIMPWASRWEQSIKKHLMVESERKRYYVEFLLDGLLRGDMQSRTGYYSTGRQWGWLSVNDIREKENMNPVEDGDIYLQPMNMIEAGNVPVASGGRGTEDGGQGTEDGGRDHSVMEVRAAESDEAVRFARERQKLAGRQARVFADVAARILRRERNDVRAQAQKALTPGTGPVVAFEQWLAEFYENHAVWSAEQMLPAMRSYGEMVADLVGRELGRGEDEDLAGLVEGFIRAYATGFGERESGRSLTRLLEIVRQSGLSQEEIRLQVDGQLDRWVEERPEPIGSEESVREGSAVAVALYETLGVVALISVATGKSSCPFCKALDGRKIGIKEYFLLAGESFKPDGAESPLQVTHSKRHSPYHGGCDCVVVAGS